MLQHEAAGLQLGLRIGQHMAHGLVAADVLAALHALLAVIPGSASAASAVPSDSMQGPSFSISSEGPARMFQALFQDASPPTTSSMEISTLSSATSVSAVPHAPMPPSRVMVTPLALVGIITKDRFSRFASGGPLRTSA